MTLKADAQWKLDRLLSRQHSWHRVTTYGNAPPFGFQPVTGVVNIAPGQTYLCAFNFSQALGMTWGWSPSQNSIVDASLGVMWAKQIPTNISGVPIVPSLSIDAINPITGNAIILTSGYVHMQGGGDEQSGWLVEAAMDDTTGALLSCQNYHIPSIPIVATLYQDTEHQHRRSENNN